LPSDGVKEAKAIGLIDDGFGADLVEFEQMLRPSNDLGDGHHKCRATSAIIISSLAARVAMIS